MQGGLFIALYDEETLKLYLNRGVYGFLMKPVYTDTPSSRSKHYAVLADYACSREGTDVFFFLKRKIVYGGKIYGNKDSGSFYINGLNSPLGRKSNANLFWDESPRYEATDKAGVFKVNGSDKSQPFMFQFIKTEDTGKYVVSDELYFELGKYPYPLPSNSMQGMGFCTLTPGEVSALMELIGNSKNKIDFSSCEDIQKNGDEQLFDCDLVDIKDDFINEAQLEFTILSTLKPFIDFLSGDYILCRQVPISPFKPMDMDRADICLYSLSEPIKDGTVPNIVIELKRGNANYKAYEQATRYLKWLEKITSQEDFEKIQAFVIADSFTRIKRSKVDTTFEDKIKILSLSTFDFEDLV
ncbi:MAG: hypothetical protein E7556_01850 [Ruminococcaceae bacterium]|nr:hypothetical protein [Oscillospiraceae bacterium]